MNLGELVIYMFNFMVSIGAILAFVVIAYNGTKLLVSKDNVAERGGVKKRIINALIGLAILLTSYIILGTINPELINVKNISIGNVSVSIPSFSITSNNNGSNYQFEEIPIGTLVENILAGTSSNTNALPCYEYEHTAYDVEDNLIIANTVDRNGDGKIDKKDTLLDKDIFYCIKLLDDAIKKKTEVHLNKLIEELDKSMHECKCSRCHYGALPSEPGDCVSEESIPGFIYPSKSTCPYCARPKSFCKSCGAAHVGCTTDSDDKYDESFASSYDGFKQYGHDPCPNRLEIDCKRQEIKQLIDGTEPDAICYKEVNGKSFLEKAPSNLFTIQQGMERLEEFKKYYDDQVLKLEAAEKKMKFPALEKLTLSEYHLLENTKSDDAVSAKYSLDNSIRYCSDFKCIEGVTSTDNSYVCTKGELNDDKRICKKNSSGEDYYFYEGDPATFYYNYQYDKDQETYPKEEQSKTCYVNEGKLSDGKYNGLIPIGETVDGTEDYGKEVSSRIEKIKDEVQGIFNVGINLYSMPDECDCGNCKSSNVAFYCLKPCCSKGGCGKCYCAPFKCLSCRVDEPIQTKMNSDGTVKTKMVSDPCFPYSYCLPAEDPGIEVDIAEDDWWVCPYNKFCGYMKQLYQRKSIDNSCYDETEDEAEAALRNSNLEGVGYVQKFEKREENLFELAAVKEIKDDKDYDSVSTVNLINSICPEYKRQIDNTNLTCSSSLSTKVEVENRFTLLQKLTTSRQRLLGCVTGYGVSYKEGADKARVFSCQEGINYLMLSKLTILPNFPYPTNNTYWNCYPLNKSTLSIEEQKACRINKDKESTDSNGPGCQEVIKEYMDNYYCCE